MRSFAGSPDKHLFDVDPRSHLDIFLRLVCRLKPVEGSPYFDTHTHTLVFHASTPALLPPAASERELTCLLAEGGGGFPVVAALAHWH